MIYSAADAVIVGSALIKKIKDFVKKKKKIEKAITYILKKHRSQDQQEGASSSMKEQEERHLSNLRLKAQKIKRWLSEHEDKIGKSGNIKKSNITDNESAKMATSHGVIQGYDGVVAADAKHQVIVHAEAFGEAQEHDLFQPMVEGTRENFQAIGAQRDIFEEAKLTADAGFHTEQNMRMLFEEQIDGYVADNLFRKRDPRFITAERHRARAKAERQKERGKDPYRPSDFIYDEASQTCICPAGKKLYRNGRNVQIRGFGFVKFRGAKMHCVPCLQRAQCLRHPERTLTRPPTAELRPDQKDSDSLPDYAMLDPMLLGASLRGNGFLHTAEFLNQYVVRYTADMIANRLVMILVAALCLAILYVRFTIAERSGNVENYSTLNLSTAAEGVYYPESSLATLPDGALFAHWLAKSGPSTYAYDVHVVRSTDDGKTWSTSIVPHRDGTRTEHDGRRDEAIIHPLNRDVVGLQRHREYNQAQHLQYRFAA